MLNFFRKPVFLVILGAALVIAAVWAYYGNRNKSQTSQNSEQPAESVDLNTSDEQPAIVNLTNVDPISVDDDFSAQLVIADSKALEVDKRLQLAGIEVDLPGEMYTSSGNVFFVYTTPNDKTNNWIIAISNSDNKFVRSRTPKVDYMGNLTAINRSFMKNNYIAALQIAEKNGGQSFREKTPPTQVKITLKNADPKGWLYWFVQYIGQSDAKQFQIDANTGAVVTQ